MTRTKPNERLLRTAWLLEHQAASLATLALQHIREELTIVDGYGSAGGDQLRVTGGGPRIMVRADDDCPHDELFPVTGVEAAMFARHALTSERERIRDDAEAIVTMVGDFVRSLRRTLGDRVPRTIPELCDGKAKGYEGHQLPYTPHSRDPQNGWHRPECRDAADASGLCPPCLQRMERWRREHGYAPVSTKAAA